MGFNYGAEKFQFDAEWIKLAQEYGDAGFCKAGIDAMREYDWELFRKRRSYANREQALPSEMISSDFNNKDGFVGDGDGRSTLLIKFNVLSCPFDESNALAGRYDWIELIDNEVLAGRLKKLSDADKELLTLLVYDELTLSEIALIQGCSHQAVSKRIQRIKKYLY